MNRPTTARCPGGFALFEGIDLRSPLRENQEIDPPAKFSDHEIVPVHIAYTEEALKQMAKNANGRWDPKAKLWRIPYGKVKGTLLEKHLILDALDK